MKILIHTCCGPCLTVPFFELQGEGEITAYFYNPNIHPSREYMHRLDSFIAFCLEENIDYKLGLYEPVKYFDQVDYHLPVGERCQNCYQLRLNETASFASKNGFQAITTTMLVSPYQDFEKIVELGKKIAADFKLSFIAQDFRQNYRHTIEESKKRNLYRQGYCGCIISEFERYYRSKEHV